MEQVEIVTALRKLTIGETGKDLRKFKYFQTLPSELRNRIYKLLLRHPNPILIGLPQPPPSPRAQPPSNFTAILSTNKKINTEAKGYYFSLNTFAVGNHTGDTTNPPCTLTRFITSAAKEDLNSITSIEIVLFAALIDDNWCMLLHNNMRARFLAFVCETVCKHFRGVKNVTVRCWSGDMVALREKVAGVPRCVHQGGNFVGIAEVLKLLLDGGEGFEGLEIERLKWSSKNVDWIEERPVIVRGPGYVPVDIPGLVEGFRDGLKDGDGVYKPLLISEEEREAFYGTVGGT